MNKNINIINRHPNYFTPGLISPRVMLHDWILSMGQKVQFKNCIPIRHDRQQK